MAKSSAELEMLRTLVLSIFEVGSLDLSDWALDPIRTSKSLRGMRIAARDAVEMSSRLSPEQTQLLNERLRGKGIPPISSFQDRLSRKVRTILSRGRINSDDEFRLVNDVVSDMDPDRLSDQERESANVLLLNYEIAQRAARRITSK